MIAIVCGCEKPLRARQPALRQIREARNGHQVHHRSWDRRRSDDRGRERYSEAEREQQLPDEQQRRGST